MVQPHQARWLDQPINNNNNNNNNGNNNNGSNNNTSVDPGTARWVTFAKERKPRPSPETLISSAPPPPRPRLLVPPAMTMFNTTTTSIPTKTTITRSSNSPLVQDSTRDRPSRQNHDKSHTIRSTSISRTRTIIPDPPQCFCRLPASQMDTAEFGIIYQCHHFDPLEQLEEDEYHRDVCAFHVHKRPWDQFRIDLQETGFVDCHSPELSVCSAFNFTFCVVFETSNPYSKRTYPPSPCFCNVPIIVHELPNNGRKKIAFSCQNFYIDGARPKCSWFLWAEQVPFRRPRQNLHAVRTKPPIQNSSAATPIESTAATHSLITASRVTETTSQTQTPTPTQTPKTTSASTTITTSPTQTPTATPTFTPPPTSTPTSASASTSLEIQSDVHQNTLLSALIKSNESPNNDNGSASTTSTNTTSVVGESSTSIASYDISSLSYQQSSLMRCLPKPVPVVDDLQPTLPIKQTNAGYENEDFHIYSKPNIGIGHIIPSTVYKNMVSGTYPVESIEWERRLALVKDKSARESRILNERLREREKFVKNLQGEYDSMVDRLDRLQLEYNNISCAHQSTLESYAAWEAEKNSLQTKRDKFEKETIKLKRSLAEEVELRLSSQRRVADLELSILDLAQKNKDLTKDNKTQKKDLENNFKDFNCRVCFQEPTEYALVPCYHYAYCLSCASKLTECAVCRTPKIAIQKVYIP